MADLDLAELSPTPKQRAERIIAWHEERGPKPADFDSLEVSRAYLSAIDRLRTLEAALRPALRIKDIKPPPHARYHVRRGDLVFTATPCYGMHAPGWVPRVPDRGDMPHETAPINMHDDDEWTFAEPDARAALQEGRDHG